LESVAGFPLGALRRIQPARNRLCAAGAGLPNRPIAILRRWACSDLGRLPKKLEAQTPVKKFEVKGG